MKHEYCFILRSGVVTDTFPRLLDSKGLEDHDFASTRTRALTGPVGAQGAHGGDATDFTNTMRWCE